MHIRLKDLTYPAIALVVALLLRYLVVESTDLALHCDMHRWEGWCGVRTALVLSFFRQDLGWVALVLSLLACWRQSLLMARLSLVAMSRVSTRMLPLCNGFRRAMSESRVLLPALLGPMMDGVRMRLAVSVWKTMVALAMALPTSSIASSFWPR